LGSVVPTPETCNGLDDDCDDAVDEDLGQVVCGLGICQVTVPACANGAPVPCVPGASAPETCDGIDNDCDGTVDNGCPCIQNQTQDCYTGSPATKDVGECHHGTQTCDVHGVWGSCLGEQLPAAQESCNGLDDDCNGTVDDGDPGSGGVCPTGQQGICAQGQWHCQNHVLVCVAPSPIAETCNGLDDDCNGVPDNGDPVAHDPCDTGQHGICAIGTMHCVAGSPSCVAPAPGTETCNGLDDDCDNQVDEGNPGGGTACDTGKFGICAAGTTQCQSAQLNCIQTLSPGIETCNGKDDDCNGTVDDGIASSSCDTGKLGVCKAGMTACQSGQTNCIQSVAASAETCNGLDDDCNGTVDDGANMPGIGGACTVTGQKGQCAAGHIHCVSGAPTCVQENFPTTESCNNLDDDCDGVVDNGNPGGGAACGTGLLGVCNAGTKTCQSGVINCVQNTPASAEKCNGLDDDCDGTADNGANMPGIGGACTVTGKQGPCANGHIHCVSGAPSCVQEIFPGVETCNGIDDDCDGTVDQNPVCCVPSGTSDCNGIAGDGCEVNLSTDGQHCGSCPNACGATLYCLNAVCANCGAGLRDCDHNGANGCEVNTVNDSDNCGACGTKCGSDGTCGCSASACSGGTVYFSEDFSDNSRGWTLGAEWQIGPAIVQSVLPQRGNVDPATDHSPSADNGIAGIVIGGNYQVTTAHSANYLTSPVINLNGVAGTVKLTYWRWLNTDDRAYTTDTVEVYNGASWVQLWQNPATSGYCSDWTPDQIDAAWTRVEFDVTSYKNANFRIRFGHATSQEVCSSGPNAGTYDPWIMSGWNLDDISLSSGTCN